MATPPPASAPEQRVPSSHRGRDAREWKMAKAEAERIASAKKPREPRKRPTPVEVANGPTLDS